MKIPVLIIISFIYAINSMIKYLQSNNFNNRHNHRKKKISSIERREMNRNIIIAKTFPIKIRENGEEGCQSTHKIFLLINVQQNNDDELINYVTYLIIVDIHGQSVFRKAAAHGSCSTQKVSLDESHNLECHEDRETSANNNQ